MKTIHHQVIASFHAPGGDPEMPSVQLGVNWLDRAAVRDFAARATEWLSLGLGYTVTTKTVGIATIKP